MMNGLVLAGVVGVLLFLLFGMYVALRSPSGVRSYLGCGVQLYDHQPRGDGTYDATRCMTVFYLPFWPLERLHVRPTGATSEYGGNYTIERHTFVRLGSSRPSLKCICRLFLFAWVVVPLVTFGPSVIVHGWLVPHRGVPLSNGATAAVAVAAVWIAAVLMFLQWRIGRVYRPQAKP
jgi:hypothetical protein